MPLNGLLSRAELLAYVLEKFQPASAAEALQEADALWRWCQQDQTAAPITGRAEDEGDLGMMGRRKPLPLKRGPMSLAHRNAIKEGLRARRERLAAPSVADQRGKAGRLTQAAIRARAPEVWALRQVTPTLSKRSIAIKTGLSEHSVRRILSEPA